MNRSTDPRNRGRGFPPDRGPLMRGPPPMMRGGGPPPGRMPPNRGGFGGRGQPMMGPGRGPPGPGRGPPMGRGPMGRGHHGHPPAMGRGPERRPLPPPPPGGRHPPPNGRGPILPPPPPPPPPPPMRAPQQPPPQRLQPPMHHVAGLGPPPMLGPRRGPPPPVHNPIHRPHPQFSPHMNGMPPSRPPPPPPPRPMQISHPAPSTVGHAVKADPTRVAGPGMPYAARPVPGGVTNHVSQATASKPVTAETAYTPIQPSQVWSEHTAPNGTKYYYNSLIQKSTYTKPDALKEKETANVSNVVATAAKSSQWKVYTDGSTGKKYYSNGSSTTWVKPADFDEPEETVAETEPEEPPRKKRKAKKETEFGSKEEAVAGFKGLLLAKDISPTQKWNEVIKICSPDSRWEACEDVLTVGERKQALAEYRTKRANDLRSIERQEKARAREAFSQLLTEVLPTVTTFSGWNTQFADVRDSLSKDDRFHTVADEATREGLFLDFCEEYRKRDERRKRNRKRDSQDAFVAFLKEKEESGDLTFASTWASFVSSLSESDQADLRFATSPVMSDADRQLYFADFVIELQTTEDDKRRRIRGAQRRAEKAQREAYVDALRRFAEDGKIIPSSRWRDSEDLIAADPTYGPIREQGRDIPGELFEDFVDEWREIYRRDRLVLNQLARSKTNGEIVVSADTTYDQFVKALMDAAANTPSTYEEARRVISRSSPVSSVRTFLKELLLGDNAMTGSFNRRGSAVRSRKDESSEDEGEIVEEGEVGD